MIGCLMYLLATRLDMNFAVCLAARYMERLTEMHVAVVKSIMRYLKGTLKFGMLYKCKSSTDLTLQGWNDSDYAGDHDDKKKVEFVSATSCACQCLWLKSVLDHLHIKQTGCIVINCDNSFSIKLSKNPIMHVLVLMGALAACVCLFLVFLLL
ncbi:hypothetical protein L195_g033876 [Trifolium pratense]|uniref:Copia-type polyprotein n=1 Tax=Trifolium pratense TaxID=57577 RepID=A0A2K3LHA3_TRIPR|nr:hypothetical protein L195_g033876 [Trifolium pratense]